MDNDQVRFASGVIILLAIWQILSPWILGYGGNMVPVWDAIDVGLPVLGLSLYRIFRPAGTATLSVVNIALGAWLAASPFALGFTSVYAALWNDITLGISILFFALVGLALTQPVSRT